MTPQPALLRHAEALLADLLGFARAADQAVSQYFRAHRQLGQTDRDVEDDDIGITPAMQDRIRDEGR